MTRGTGMPYAKATVRVRLRLSAMVWAISTAGAKTTSNARARTKSP
jgi:hypothetical protein